MGFSVALDSRTAALSDVLMDERMAPGTKIHGRDEDEAGRGVGGRLPPRDGDTALFQEGKRAMLECHVVKS